MVIETLKSNRPVTFAAPWGWSLKLVTILMSVILLGVALTGAKVSAAENPVIFLSMVVLPLVLLISAMLFVIRGYEIREQHLAVKRMGWVCEINLSELVAAYTDPQAMARSIRLFGNGGLFCFAGLFVNKTLGRYRVFATDPGNAVVLKFSRRTVVVSPGNPEQFVSTISKFIRGNT
ncbi:MAG: PH domain-containing protein [Gammaproteobacteria bacterium]